MKSIDQMIDDILRREGGYVDDPVDRGGATNWGITIGTLSDWLGRSATKDEVRNLPRETARDIYRQWYYIRPHINVLPPELQPQMFDMAVNHGPSGAVRILQSLVNDLDIPQIQVDGLIGHETRSAVGSLAARLGWERLNNALVDERKSFYRRIIRNDPSQKRFERGWLSRAEEFRVPELVPTPPLPDEPVKKGQTVLDRLKEPSTWAAFGALLVALGIGTDLDAETWQQIGAGIAAVVSVIGVILKEKGGA